MHIIIHSPRILPPIMRRRFRFHCRAPSACFLAGAFRHATFFTAPLLRASCSHIRRSPRGLRRAIFAMPSMYSHFYFTPPPAGHADEMIGQYRLTALHFGSFSACEYACRRASGRRAATFFAHKADATYHWSRRRSCTLIARLHYGQTYWASSLIYGHGTTASRRQAIIFIIIRYSHCCRAAGHGR